MRKSKYNKKNNNRRVKTNNRKNTRSKNNKTKNRKYSTYKPTPTRKYILVLIIMFIIIGILYSIIPDAITVQVGIDEEQEDSIREIVRDEVQKALEEYTNASEEQLVEEVTEEVIEEVQDTSSVPSSSVDTTQVTSRSSSSRTTSTILTGYRVTSYYPGDGCASTNKTGSGLTTSDFSTTTVEGKTVYTYKGRIVVAAATKELLATGYSVKGSQTSQPDKHYFSYYDTLTLTINGNQYEAVVLDSCGAAMWSGEYRIDIYVPSASNVINASNVTIKY